MDIAAALREARAATGLSQKRFARRAGVSASSLSRYESGTVLPSLAMLDHLLATCGKDLRLVVVERVDDLEVEFARRARLTLHDRLRAKQFLWPSFLERLARIGPDILVGGQWAAELHGIPSEPAPGRVLIRDDPEVFTRVAAAFMRGHVPWRSTEGHFGSLPVRPETFVRYPEAQWWQDDVGYFDTRVVAVGLPWPLECRVETPAGPLRVQAAQELSEHDGVLATTLSAWSAWRAEAGPDTAPWSTELWSTQQPAVPEGTAT